MDNDQTTRARLLVVDDHALMRLAIKSVLGRDTSLEVVGEAEDGQEAIACCRELRPDLVLMDVSMPKMDGIEATREIKAQFPKTSVLILTAHTDHRLLVDAVKAGAAGYVLKDSRPNYVLDAVKAVLGGESPLDQELVMQLLRSLAGQAPHDEEEKEDAEASEVPPGTSRRPPQPASLTDRELEVLRLIARGLTNREIARDLLVSVGTVKAYVRRIIAKLEVSDRTQAAVRAMELGILPSEW